MYADSGVYIEKKNREGDITNFIEINAKNTLYITFGSKKSRLIIVTGLCLYYLKLKLRWFRLKEIKIPKINK